jgi:hypothetical protein
MQHQYSQAELECYLDEALSPARMAEVEAALRAQPELAKRLIAILRRRDAGLHSLGEIWRRHRVSCPSRQDLGNFLLGVLNEAEAAFVCFHVEHIGCRLCNANLEDMRRRQQATTAEEKQRQQKFFHTSAGYLKGKR